MDGGGRFFGMATRGSLTLHGAILAGLAAVSYLRVEPLARPHIPERPMLQIALPQSPGTSSPPRSHAGSAAPAARARERIDVAPRSAPRAAQPRQVQEAPPSNDTVPGSGASSEDDGAGGHFGVPGGTGVGEGYLPWGGPGGGGGGWGSGPGNVLEGLPEPRPVHLTTDVVPPEKIVDVQPVYPETARIARKSGTVVLQIVIGRDGAVEEAVVVGSAPLFDEAALAAVRRWRYRPALLAGRPVRVYQTVRVVFALR